MKAWLILALAIFLALTLYQLNLPGLHYDEAFEVVPAVQLLNNQPVNAFRNSVLPLFGRAFPLMTQDYIGALNTYGALPFLALGGISVFSLRLYSIFIGLITLALVYGFSASLSGRKWAGVAAVALLALNPTFIFWTRQGIFVTAITAAIGVASAWAWLIWQRTKSYRYALLGAFLFGLGLYAKLLFIWLIGALFGAFVLNEMLQGRLGQWRSWLLALSGNKTGFAPLAKRSSGLIGAGLLGCWPLLIYNLQTGGTFQNVESNAATSYYGVNNADVFSNLSARFEQLGILLNSGHLWYLGQVYSNPLAVIAFGLMLIAALWLAIKHKQTVPLVPFVVIVLVVCASIVTVSALWITHFALLMVWPAIAIAIAGTALLEQVAPQRPARLILVTGLALLLISEGATTWRYHQALSISGGLSDHSDAVYDMADWLDTHATADVVAMDWGMAAGITFLTAGRVTPVEVFGYAWASSDRFEEIVAPRLIPNAAIFLWRSPDETIFERSAEFKALYQPLNLEEDILEAFYERNGRPILGATMLVPVGEAENKPQ